MLPLNNEYTLDDRIKTKMSITNTMIPPNTKEKKGKEKAVL